MSGARIVIELTDAERAREVATGGVFVTGCTLALNDDCELVVIGARELTLPGRIVFVDARGAGIEIVGFSAALKQELARLVESKLDEDLTQDGLDTIKDGTERELAQTMHQRLRGLTLAEAIKKAQSGDPTERMLLERMYGKSVWEPLLRNSRITVPEVTRIARMGTLPRTLIEVIVGNGTWVQIPEVRRALLGNPRLGTDQILRVLRMMPKPELKIASSTAVYPHAVRDAAKRMFRESQK